jgi:RNA polymerase sigma-70 factor (ECF subfamily)
LGQSYASLDPPELIRVCAESPDPAAWDEFLRRYHRLICLVVIRTAKPWSQNSQQVWDDLVQETYLKLCKDRFHILRTFQSHHADALAGFLQVIAANVVRDHFKAKFSDKRGKGVPAQSIDIEGNAPTEAGFGSVATLERDVLLGEIDTYLRTSADGQTGKRDRELFWLHYRHGLSAKAIASIPAIGLTSHGVESALLRLVKTIRTRMKLDSDAGNKQVQSRGFSAADSL